MTPQERRMVAELFERLAKLENSPRDKDAARAIADGQGQAPNAIYPLVQTVLVQDEALKRADARIRELTGEDEPASGGFLDSMRNALMGRPSSTSVPSVRSGPDPRWNTGGALSAAPQAAAPIGGGGSFLGTAAASAAGVIGGALLLNSIGSMFGNHGRGNAFAGETPAAEQPWSGVPSDSDLSRITNDRSVGLFDSGDTDVADLGEDFGSDTGGGDSA